MSPTRLFVLAVGGLLVSSVVLAGVEPSPFRSELSKLSSVEKVLGDAGDHLVAALDDYASSTAHPPEPGITGRVTAIGLRVGVADGRVAAVLSDLHPPEPGVPVDRDVAAALAGVSAEALAIWDLADSVVHPPEPGTPPPDDDVIAALVGVQGASSALVERIEAWDEVPGGCTDDACVCEEACGTAFDACMEAATDDSGAVDETAAAACRRALEVCASECVLDPPS